MSHYQDSLVVENILSYGTDSSTYVISTDTTLTILDSLVSMDVQGSDRNVTLPSSGIKGQLLTLHTLATSVYNAVIQVTNTNLLSTLSLKPKDVINFIYTGSSWENAQTNSLNSSYGWARTATYRGNAGTGTYLQFVFSGGSDDYPYVIPVDARIHAITINAPAAVTVTVTFYKFVGGIETSVGNVSLANEAIKKIIVDWPLNELDQLRCAISAGSISKPTVEIYFKAR